MPQRYTPRPFRSAWWVPGAHAQTIVGRYLRRTLRLALRRERLETPDGDFLDLDFPAAAVALAAPDTPTVLVLHGLEGSAASGYVAHTLRYLVQHRIRGVALNFRSCSGEPNRLARLYHAGDTADLRFVLGRLRERFPAAPLGAVGFSLGGNVLLKYLGEEGEAAPLRAAVAVSVPFDLAAGAAKLERGMGRVYTRHFLRKLRGKSLEKAHLLDAREHAARLRRARTLRQFDDAATAPLHGFRDAEEYYSASSAARYLHAIRLPTLLLHSVDDPFLPASAVPRAVVLANPHLVDGFTNSGGHVGFVAGRPWAPVFWAEREAVRFLDVHLRAPQRRATPPTAIS
mgnify:FL=1